MTVGLVSRLGPRGQLVLKKSLRDKIGLKEGMLVEEKLTANGILVRAVEASSVLKSVEETAKRVSRKWPKNLDSVEAVRRERR